MHKINYVGFGDSFESVCSNGQAPWEEPGQPRSYPPRVQSVFGEVEGARAALSSLKAAFRLCACTMGLSLSRDLCFRRWKWSFNAIHGLLLPVSVLDAFGVDDFMGQRLLTLVGQRRSPLFASRLVAKRLPICKSSEVSNVVCRAGEGCGNGGKRLCQPRICNRHLRSRGVGRSRAALHLLHPGTTPGWWNGKHPLPQFPKCPLISARLQLKQRGDGFPHPLVGCLYEAKQSKMRSARSPVAWCLLSSVSRWFDSSWQNCRHPQTEPLLSKLSFPVPAEAGKPVRKDAEHGALVIGLVKSEYWNPTQTSSPYHTEFELMNELNPQKGGGWVQRDLRGAVNEIPMWEFSPSGREGWCTARLPPQERGTGARQGSSTEGKKHRWEFSAGVAGERGIKLSLQISSGTASLLTMVPALILAYGSPSRPLWGHSDRHRSLGRQAH